jgi:WXXGXW repeat (2 copies)
MRFGLVVRSVLVAILLIGVLSVSGAAFAQVRVAIAVGPPVLPVYEQPICPGDGYFWTPGYWDYDYDAADYFWVPGTWVLAPEVGFLWTPPYWGWGGSGFLFYDGYWGPTIGFYGGINYGFGYFGTGFYGGRWEGGHFFYNTSVWHVGGDFHNVYNERVNINNENRVSFNGHGGIDARPTAQEEAAAHERHVGPVAAQTQHRDAARSDPQQRASFNHGQPGVVATAKPGDFKNGAVRGGVAGGRAESAGGRTPVHPNDLPAVQRPAAPNTGDAKQDQKYQKEQDKLVANQQKERDNLQKQQDKEHQQLTKQKANDTRTQQVEQKHTQQTQQLQQKHTQQVQQMQQRQSAPASHPSGGGKPK